MDRRVAGNIDFNAWFNLLSHSGKYRNIQYILRTGNHEWRISLYKPGRKLGEMVAG
jgi:hypothetical protein